MRVKHHSKMDESLQLQAYDSLTPIKSVGLVSTCQLFPFAFSGRPRGLTKYVLCSFQGCSAEHFRVATVVSALGRVISTSGGCLRCSVCTRACGEAQHATSSFKCTGDEAGLSFDTGICAIVISHALTATPPTYFRRGLCQLLSTLCFLRKKTLIRTSRHSRASYGPDDRQHVEDGSGAGRLTNGSKDCPWLKRRTH